MLPKTLKKATLAILLALAPLTAQAGETTVAVAANFTAAAKELATLFTEKTGHTTKISFGSTGALYNQIANGAPFEVFLAADSKRPEKAEAEGLAVAGSRFTYATGKIVLYSSDPALVDADGKVLTDPSKFNRLAIANPKTAPYGVAALQALDKLGLSATLADKIVRGDNIAQTHQFVVTGNAELGFVALAQIALKADGSRWIVDESLYEPIRQQAVLLKTGEANDAAKAFLDFLQSADAKTVIKKYGYGLE